MADELKINRRQFVVAGSTGLVGLSVALPSLGEDVPIVASIGYWLGSARLSSPSIWRTAQLDDVWFDVVPGARSPQSNPEFIGTGVRLTVAELQGNSALEGFRTVTLESEATADFNGKARRLPFHVWSLEQGPVRKESAPVGFNATVGFGRPVVLNLSLTRGGRTRGVRTSDVRAHEVEFRFAMEDGTDARLNRGVYFLGFGPEPVDWDRLSFSESAEGGGRRLVEHSIVGQRTVAFPYFIVEIDHGTFFGNGA